MIYTYYIHSLLVQDLIVSGQACCMKQYHYELQKLQVVSSHDRRDLMQSFVPTHYKFLVTLICLFQHFNRAWCQKPVWSWSYDSWIYNYMCNQCLAINTTVVNSNPVQYEVYSIQHYVIKFVCDLRQVGSFLRVLRFPPPRKLTAMI